MQARLAAVGITYSGYSYGTFGNDGCHGTYFFGQGDLLGASASGNGLTLFSYTDGLTDKGAPVAQLSFTRCLTAAC
jgi:hypothetical protein